MSSITGIPTTRVSDLFIRQRMLTQIQSDQAALYQVQSQLSTGRRFVVPSEDPVAALRVMSLQSLIERKQQVMANLNTNMSFLGATDSAISNVSNMLNDVKAAALGVIGTTATDEQRQAAVQVIAQSLRQLVDTGNQQFRGRYLFAGSSSTVQPMAYLPGGFIDYLGNSQSLESYGDIDLLFATNLTGVETFGAISNPVRGNADLNPVLTFDTRISDVLGGTGLTRGSIAVSDGVNTSVIDLSSAATVGDLAMLIQANPPAGRSLQVDITPDRLVITLDSNSVGSLAIREVGGGTLANELGLLKEIGTNKSIAGRDLDPVLKLTTPLGDVLGVRARTSVRSEGTDNNFILEADRNGAATADGRPLNDVTISFVDNPLVQPGNETVIYDGANSIVVHISSGYSQARQVVAALNAAQAAGEIPFTARLDPLDSRSGGRGTVQVNAKATTEYGAGENFDKSAGMKIINQDKEFNIAFPLARTVEDVLNTLNGANAGLLAEINDTNTGINLRNRVSGCDFSIGENGGTTATQLGLRTFAMGSSLDDLNFGRGVDDWPGSGARSQAVYDSLVPNASLTFSANKPGTYWNEFDIQFVDTLAAPSLTYDVDAKTMTYFVNANTTANDIVNLTRNHPTAGADWTATLTPTSGTPNTGTGKVVAGTAETAGGDDSGVDFTITRADGTQLDIDIAGMRTIGEVIDAINHHPSNKDGMLVAQAKVYGNGIELVDNSEGTETLTVTRAILSQAAIDLGLIPTGGSESEPATAIGYPQTIIDSAAAKSGLIIAARAAGTAINGVQVVFQDGGPAAPVYDAVAQTLTFGITAGTTTAQDVAAMLAASPLNAVFSATFDPANNSGNDGSGLVVATDPLDPPRTAAGNATTYARATVTAPGFDNDLIFTSKQYGAGYNNVAVRLVEAAGGPTQVVNYNPGVELVVQFDPGVATANDIVAAVGLHAAANAAFSVTRDPVDASPNDGSGLVDATDGTEPLMAGGSQAIGGRDVNPLETDSVFTALIRIQQGLESNDAFLIERSLALLDRKTTDLNFSRADLGARQQSVEVLQFRLDNEDVELQMNLSIDYDADLAEVISNLTSRQASFDASLQAMAKIYQMSLLNYL